MSENMKEYGINRFNTVSGIITGILLCQIDVLYLFYYMLGIALVCLLFKQFNGRKKMKSDS